MHGSINPPSPSTAAIGGPLGKGNFAPIELFHEATTREYVGHAADLSTLCVQSKVRAAGRSYGW